MKKTISILATLCTLGGVSQAVAQDTKYITPDVSVNHFKIDRNGRYLTVEMEVGIEDLEVESNRAVLLTPRLVNGNDSMELPSIGVYGRRRYYYYTRNEVGGNISGKDEASFRAKRKPNSVNYLRSIDYEDWMDGATLKFHRSDWGCCHEIVAEYDGHLGKYNEAFFPELIFVQPQAEAEKTRSISGSAFIDFPVDQTVIYPDYRNNTVELGKIEATIDSIRSDKDITIDSVFLKGFASPESPYSHNRDLAMGRTKALKEHIRKLYNFADNVIFTDYEPEDWAGLRRYVEKSNLEHRMEILALIDSNLEPDAKEKKIKCTYPEEYRFLLKHSYPALRHTDYRVYYIIRTYSVVDEIKRVMAEQPQKLSQNEFYLVADTYEPGTPEFTEVFETAVRMFPADEVANLNAANAAMRRGNNEEARRYLAKAGNSAEAVYARGALAIREKDYPTAVTYLEQARKMGLEKADATLQELKNRE